VGGEEPRSTTKQDKNESSAGPASGTRGGVKNEGLHDYRGGTGRAKSAPGK